MAKKHMDNVTYCKGPQSKMIRCFGTVEKCDMYSKFNWDSQKCSCERKPYCKKKCPEGEQLDPTQYCKCVKYLEDVIPLDFVRYDDPCPETHFYNENCDCCIDYDWTPEIRTNECNDGKHFDYILG